MVLRTSIGVHVADSGNPGDLLEVVEILAATDNPVPAVLVVNDGGLANAIKQRSPKTYVVFRGNVQGGGEGDPFGNLRADGTGSLADPVAWYRNMTRYNSQAAKADAFSMYNERTFAGNGQTDEYAKRVGDWELAVFHEAEKDLVKIAWGNHWVGTPEEHHVKAMADMVAHAEAHQHPNIYHAYSSNIDDRSFLTLPQFFATRPMRVYAKYPKLIFIMGEAGHYHGPTYRGVDDMVRMWDELDSLYMPYILQGWDIRACYWTIKGQAENSIWKADDWTPQLKSVYLPWMLKKATPTVPIYSVTSPLNKDTNLVLSDGVFDANPIGTEYRVKPNDPASVAYHTGADLNKNTPVWDSDAHAPVYAIGNGPIIASADYPTWGRIMIQELTLDGGRKVYVRYAHVETPKVAKGTLVSRGQQIANVGNANGGQPYHLHFDVSPTSILKERPDYWPKLDLAGLRANFIDPIQFVRTATLPPTPVSVLKQVNTVGSRLLIRQSASTSAAVLGSLAHKTQVRVVDYNADWYALAERSGYVNKCCLIDVLPEPEILTVWINAKPHLNIRADASINSADLGDILYGESVGVDAKSGDWYHLVDDRGWISATYTQLLPIVIAPTWKMPIKASERGVHGNAGGYAPVPNSPELGIVRGSNMQWMFIAAYQTGQQAAVNAFRAQGVNNFVIRSAMSGKIGTPTEFFNGTISALRGYASVLPAEFMINIHNEPNIRQEGAGDAWKDGAAFAKWWIAVRDMYRKEFPQARFGFPALSPGGETADRMDEANFIFGAKPAINEADFVGVHYYWEREDGSDIAPPFNKWDNWFGSKPKIGTEIGPANLCNGTATAYQRAFTRFAAGNVPMAAWLLNGIGSFDNADMVKRGIVVPA